MEITADVQFYLRCISVFIGVLLNAIWMDKNANPRKGIYLALIIVALYLGLYY